MGGQLLEVATLTHRTRMAFDGVSIRHSTEGLLYGSPRRCLPEDLPRLLEKFRINVDGSAFGHAYMIPTVK